MPLGEAQLLRVRDVALRLSPIEEWREVFNDVWRQARDSFWDPAMGGIDWLATYHEHAAELPRLGSRMELDHLMRRMLSRLRVLHTFPIPAPSGGMPPSRGASRDASALALDVPGSLGALLRTARDMSGVEVVQVWCGDIEKPACRSPLSSPHYGQRVAVGDIITHVNGIATPTVYALEAALIGKAEERIRLRVAPPFVPPPSSSSLSSSSSSSVQPQTPSSSK